MRKTVGFVGLGKLGLPVAVCLGQSNKVIGYDINPDLRTKRVYEHRELGPHKLDDFQAYFNNADLHFSDSLRSLASESEIVFVAVQTPHSAEYEGVTRLPAQRMNFDYRYLVQAVRELSQYTRPDQPIVVISTVLPGTMREHIIPLLKGVCGLPDRGQLVYNPHFIAMGTVMYDYFNPEFVLLGGDNREAVEQVRKFYHRFFYNWHCSNPEATLGWTPTFREMSVESAELTKVAYNTIISSKVVIANCLMEICHRIPGCNVDDVTGALKLATDRVVSPKYMDGGMADGGGCHPRDNIAMSWLARKLDLSYDLFGSFMQARESQAEWLVSLVRDLNPAGNQLPVVLLGKSYKPESNIQTGSGAMLVANLLSEKGIVFRHVDPIVDEMDHEQFSAAIGAKPKLYLVTTKHKIFSEILYPRYSIVIDPFRYIPRQCGDNVLVVPVGIGEGGFSCSGGCKKSE